MPRYDFTTQRLHVNTELFAELRVDLDRNQANYLLNVLRLKQGDEVLVFNGHQGEWRAQLMIEGRKKAHLQIVELMRAQTPASTLRYLFAPLKQARLDYMVQKAVEMGAGVLQPVLTQYTQVRKLNKDRMVANAIEAAEQCGILTIPLIEEPVTLAEFMAVASNTPLIFCDEGEGSQNPLPLLSPISPGPVDVLIGPEGGFSPEERQLLRSASNVVPIPLGPRVLRADTAAIAALALVQASIGDWQNASE